MVRTIELEDKGHFSRMMQSMKQMKHDEDLCDFTIQVEGLEFQAHKVILSAGSPYFKAMLKHDTVEREEGRVVMEDVDFECVKSCIDFIYSGNFDIPDGKTRQLLHVAIMMQLEDVKEAICNILEEDLKPEIFYETKNIAEFYDLQNVATKCKVFYRKNLMKISLQPGFRNETKADVLDLLKSDEFSLEEEEKMALSLRWVAEKPQQNDVLLELFNLINVHRISSKYLEDILENHPLVSNDLRLYKMLNASYVRSLQNANKKAMHEEINSVSRIALFDSTNDCLRLFNPTTNKMIIAQTLKFKHFKRFNVVSIDSCIYVLCESKSVHRLNVKEENPRWQPMQDMIFNHGQYPPCVSLTGSIFVIASSLHHTADVEVFNPVINEWTVLKDKPNAIKAPTLVSSGDSIYCIGGKDPTEPVATFCKFTPLSSEWIDLEPMKNARYACGATVIGQKIFVMGGRTGSGASSLEVSDAECYDVTLRQWTSLSPMTESYSLVDTHHFNGWLFVVGRRKGSDRVEKYAVANDEWIKADLKDDDYFIVWLSCILSLPR